MASNLNGNPFVQSVNQTVLGNVKNSVSGALSNLKLNAQGELGPAGSIIANLLGKTSTSGIASSIAGSLISSNLDTLISGAESYFVKNSPLRAFNLPGRNLSMHHESHPEISIPAAQTDTTGGPSLVFPPEMPPYFMKFTFHSYIRRNPFDTTELSPIGSVVLPLPDGEGLVDNTTAKWNSEPLGLAGNVYDNLKHLAAIGSGGNLTNDLNVIEAGGLDTGYYIMDKLGKKLGSKIGIDSNELVGTFESTAGIVPNPSLAMLFSGIDFRTFAFRWTFAPKTAEESNTIREICDLFKRNHLPTFSGGTTSLLMDYPSLVKPSFSDQAGSYMTDFKYAIIKSVNIQYSPHGTVPSFYVGTAAPTFITLEITIEETEYRLSQDYGGASSGKSVGNLVSSTATSFLDTVKGAL